jgi:excisionase family DNA binding protein
MTQTNQQTDVGDILTDVTAAAYVGGIEPRTIRDWRTRRGLPFIRITPKVIRIRRADLEKWLARHQVATLRGAQ